MASPWDQVSQAQACAVVAAIDVCSSQQYHVSCEAHDMVVKGYAEISRWFRDDWHDGPRALDYGNAAAEKAARARLLNQRARVLVVDVSIRFRSKL